MKTRALIAAVILTTSGTALAVERTYRVENHFSIQRNGTLILENPVGDIQISGADINGVHVEVLKSVVAKDEDGLEEGRFFTELVVGGNDETRVLRTQMGTGARKKEWASSVMWRVSVPRTVNVRVASTSSNRIVIGNLRGTLYVKNFEGNVVLQNNIGAVTVESVNGSIIADVPADRGETRLTTINGHITVRVPADADVRWFAESIAGDIRTNLPVRGMFAGPALRGSINAPGGVPLYTATLTGNVHLLGSGMTQRPQSVRTIERILIPPEQKEHRVGDLRRPLVNGSITYTTVVGDVVINEIRGGALLTTGAGRVELGSVDGDATVRSRGGALQLGEILGTLNASTRAGDIFVEAARRGGTLETTGGTIRLIYTGGPTRITTGGGDIVVRQAFGPTIASTRSGDISVTMDPSVGRQLIDLRTENGNIVLNVSPKFTGDIDLTIFTTDPVAHKVTSDLAGLSITNEAQADGRTRIRATGKVNGGGERVTLQATGGSIRILTSPVAPTLLGR